MNFLVDAQLPRRMTGWLTAAATNAATACASLPWTRSFAIAPLPPALPVLIVCNTRLYGGRS